MRKKKSPVTRVIFRIQRLHGRDWFIRKCSDGKTWTTYPFLYATCEQAQVDLNKIIKGVVAMGFEVVQDGGDEQTV